MKKATTMEMAIVRIVSDGTLNKYVRLFGKKLPAHIREEAKAEMMAQLLDLKHRGKMAQLLDDKKLNGYIFITIKMMLTSPTSEFYRKIITYEKKKQELLPEYLDRED